jgi:chemotaxis protein MotA
MMNAGSRSRPDFATVLGLVLAMCGLLGGFFLEGGKPQAIIGESAALIVFGGCLGATLVAHPLREVLSALRALRWVFGQPADGCDDLVEEILALARLARKNGLVSLENNLDLISDSVLRKGVGLAVDGVEPEAIQDIVNTEIEVRLHRMERDAQVLESAGGFSPTIGIIGAVLGLIITMARIDDTKNVGRGIAAAFVATIYGVGFANLFLLPAAAKIRARAARSRECMQLMLLGSIALAEGVNPKLLREKIECFLTSKARPQRGGAVLAAQRVEG